MIQISLKADHDRPAGETTFSLFFIFAIFQGGGEGPDLQPHIYIYIPKYMPTYIHVHTCMYIHTCIHKRVHTYTCTYIHTFIDVHTYKYILVHTYIHTYIHVHTYMHVLIG